MVMSRGNKWAFIYTFMPTYRGYIVPLMSYKDVRNDLKPSFMIQ